jgi:hypothetical protein
VNDYQKELWNGSLGRIESILSSNGKRSMLCSLDGARQEIPEEHFHRIDLAYAITVHKAQGTQKGDRACCQEPLVGSYSDLHRFDAWKGTGRFHR